MKITKIVFTIFNGISSLCLLFLGVIMLLFNVFGLWRLWHLVGFLFVFFIPIPLLFSLVSLMLSSVTKDIKLIITNAIIVFVSILSIAFSIAISGAWFW